MGPEKYSLRNNNGLTLPFALILTFIFSALVAVAYLFITVNIQQVQSSLASAQAIAVCEGINERIKARLNTKSKIQPSPAQEARLSQGQEEEPEETKDEDNEVVLDDEDFDEETESFDEYYADEVIKISRLITFREPPEELQTVSKNSASDSQDANLNAAGNSQPRPEANVEMIGSITIPRGTVLNKGMMIIVYKEQKINLKLDDIVPDAVQGYKLKLPAPYIKSLTPNYSEPNTRSSFIVNGENLPQTPPSFSNKNITVENVKAGPTVDFLVGNEVMAGITRFFWSSSQSEFYIIPSYDKSPAPVITEIKTTDGNQFLEIKAGKRQDIKIEGTNLSSKLGLPVVIPDVSGLVPKVKDQSPGKNEMFLNLTVGRKVEPGVHTLVVATEGGLSNSWLFNVLPYEEEKGISANTATYTSSLTLLSIRVVENLLPLIDEGEPDKQDDDKDDNDSSNNQNDPDNVSDDGADIPEKEKLSPFANVDLETVWLLETSVMVGVVTKTASEIIERQIPNIRGAITTNGEITFEGGDYQIIGASTAMTVLVEPTYLSNTLLKVQGPKEEDLLNSSEVEPGRSDNKKDIPKTPGELGFLPGGLVSVYKVGEDVRDLDYAVIGKVGLNTIDLVPPGLTKFHYEGDEVFQFVPPVISKEKIEGSDSEKHIVPKSFAITLPNAARFQNIFRSNLGQFSELADLYTNETDVPKDEAGIPLGYMSLSYISATPTYNENNALNGKGILIIDTRADNLGRAEGTVEITGDSKNPADFSGIIYVHGNLRISGNVTINGALVVDNDRSRGKIEIASNALGRIAYDPRQIKQTLLSIPFSTRPGTVMISNKSIDLAGYVQSATLLADKTPAVQTTVEAETQQTKSLKGPESIKPPEEPQVETIKQDSAGGNAEKDLLELF